MLCLGGAAGLALGMMAVGVLLGIVVLIIYRRVRVVTPDRRNILDRYLDNAEY